jgi:hypothetical protein
VLLERMSVRGVGTLSLAPVRTTARTLRSCWTRSIASQKPLSTPGLIAFATRPLDVVSQRKPPRRFSNISAEGSVINHQVRIEAGTLCEAEPAVRADGTQ